MVLDNLSYLFLGGNQLTGCIPDGLKDVANNDLSLLNLPDCEAETGRLIDPWEWHAVDEGSMRGLSHVPYVRDGFVGLRRPL